MDFPSGDLTGDSTISSHLGRDSLATQRYPAPVVANPLTNNTMIVLPLMVVVYGSVSVISNIYAKDKSVTPAIRDCR